MRLLLRAIALLPLPLLYPGGWLIYFIVFRIARWRVPQVERDLELAFPEKTPRERALILRQSYRNIADVVMEILWGFGASAEALKQRVSFDNPEIVDSSVATRQSVVLLAPHFCNWEWLISAGGAAFQLPIDAVYQTLRVKSVDVYIREARSRFGGKPIPREDFVYEVMNRAGTPRGYGLIADQTPPRAERKHWTRFLNRDTAFFVGAEKIARFLDAKVLYVAMRRERRGHYAVRLVPIADPPHDFGERRDYSPIMEAFARNLEKSVRESPGDWLWLQKRWKYPKDEPAAPAPPSVSSRSA